MNGIGTLVLVASLMATVLGGLSVVAHIYNLNGIKSKTVGDGQHGTARFSTNAEIRKIYKHIPFTPSLWRKGQNLPTPVEQGIILGSTGAKNQVTAVVDSDDVHCMMIGASGVGKTAYFLYPNLEFACASGMSFLTTDTKGDLYRNYGHIAKEHYGYNVSVIDLRNPTRSDGNNLLHFVNKYMDEYKVSNNDLSIKAKAEKYAKITSKTIINSGGENYGQNQFFYDSAEGLLTAVILLVAEYLAPQDEDEVDCRHIVSVFKLVQELVAPSGIKGKPQFTVLIDKLPEDHKAKWFAGAAINSAEQAMASILSTILSRLNCFLDSEMEQILCFETAIDAERFCKTKSALFIVLPEEDATKYFMVSLMIQQLYREILTVADEQGGKLENRVVFYCDELGTLPAIQSLELIFSASRSRRLSMVPIIQSFGQLEKNYGKEGSEIIIDNCQDTIFGGFAPNSQTAEVLSKALGSRTVMSGSVSRSKNDPSQSLQMIERPLMTPAELKSIPKGNFIVMKTGTYPMKTKLKLFFDWGIVFDGEYIVEENGNRQVHYASKDQLEHNILASQWVLDEVAEEYPPEQDMPTETQREQHKDKHYPMDNFRAVDFTKEREDAQ